MTSSDNDLHAFTKRGINNVPFNRGQLSTKFAHWKASKECAIMEGEERYVKDEDVPAADELLRAIRNTAYYKYSPRCEDMKDFFDESVEVQQLCSSFRKTTIKSINEALSSTAVTDTSARSKR